MHSIQKRLSFVGFELLFILLAGFCQLDGQVKSVRRNNSSFQYSTTQPSTSKAVNAEVGGGTLPQELAAGSEIVSFMKGDSVLGRITFDPNETVNVIVQFKTPPLVLHKHYSKHFAPATYSSTLRQIQTEHQQCMRDVTSIESAPLSPLPKSFKPSATHLKYEYKRSLNGIAISTRRWMVEQIKELPYVERVDDDVQVQLVDDVSNDVIRADTVWAKTGAEGDSVVIGILDTGIDYLHEALGGAPFPNTKVIGGYDLVNNDADPMDDNGHGTHVAGIAAANGPPPTSLRGVAPHAKLMAFKVLDATGSGSSSSVIAGIEMALDPDGNPATDDAVDIINLSLGGSGDPDDPLCQAVDNAVANGVECVVAAGNSGSSYKTIQSPGVARTALTVGATDNTDHIASFSSRGPSKKLFGIKPDVLAPGVSINSAKAGGGYIQYSGTSMSTPHVAGASALLLQLHRGSSPAVIKGLLMETAKNIGANLWTQGSGRIDVYAAALKPGVVTPASLNLGFYDLNQSTWTEQETLAVRNMSGNSPTYQFSLMAGAPNGVSATFTPSSIALNPGDTAIVVISFSVNGNLVANNNPSGSVSFPYTGTVRAVSQSDTISVPFSFMKTPYLDLTLVGTNPSFLIHNGRDFSVTSLTTSDYPRILLPSGTYDIVALFFSSVQNTYVTRENIAVPATSQITLQQSDAQHVYSIDARDENSQQMNFDRQTTADQFVHRASQFAISSLVLNAPYIPNARYSNVSSAYNYDWQSYSYPNNKPFYTFKGSINDFSADHSFRNYPSDFKHLLLVYTLPPSLTNIMLLEWLNFFRDPQGMGSFWGGSDTYMTAPFIQNAYIMPDPTADFMAGWGLYNLQEVMQTTGPVFNRDASFLYYVLPWLKVKSFTSTQAFLLWDNFSPALDTPGDTLVYGLGPTHWFGRFDNDATNLRIRTNTKYGEYWNSSQGAFYPLFLSQCQDASTKQLTFKLFDASNALIQSGALLDHGTRIITAGNYYDYFADIQVGTGGTYRLEIQDTAYFVQGRQGVALMRATMNTMSGDPNPPSMKTFNILAGNTFTDIITDGQTGTVKFQVNDDHGLQSVVASYRAESDTAWNNLVVTQDSTSYSAIINSNIPHGYVSLRVTATDNSGNTLEYSASPAFKLGSGFPVCVLSCDTMNLGWVLLGTPFIDSMTVTNTGSSVLNVDTVRSDDLWITISPHSASLVPLASQKFYITYTAASVGTHYGHIIFGHNAAGSPDSVVVKGLNVTTMGQGCAIVPASLNLGTVTIGSSRTDSLMATNTGATRLLLSAHLSSDPFGLSLTPCCRSISALTSRSFYVTWAPPSTGVYNGIAQFDFSGTGSPILVPVTGAGINSAPSVSPTSITFGNVLTTTPRRDSITVTNTGPVVLHLYSIASSTTSFIITPKSDSLNPSTSKKYYVVFSPADTGIKTGAIVFTHDAAGPPDTVSVNGRGIAPTFSASTSSFVFGNLLVHGSKTDSFSLSNRGNVVVHFSATLTPTVGPFQFSPVTDSISPSGSRTFRVTFNPSDTGTRAGNIVVTFDAAGSPDTIPVNGRGIAPGFSSADTVNLGWVLLGVPFVDSLTVTNTGSSVLNVDTVRSDDTRITVSPHSASLVPLASQKFYITYTPDSVGAHSGHIIFWHNAAGSPDSVVVSGLNVTTMGQGCAIMPASLNLGTVCIGSSRMDSLMATNTGATRLLLSAHLSTDPIGLSLTPSNRIISALTSRYFYVTWAPPSAGVYNGIAEFDFSGTGSPILVPVTGAGINSAPSVSPASITFGDVLTTVPKRDSVIVTNTGPVLLHLYSITSSSKSFIITPKSDSLNPNTGKKYYLTFSPADTGMKAGAIVFTHDAAGPPDTVVVNGRGIAPTFSASTSSLVFGNLLVRGSKTDSFSLSNRGNAVLHFSAVLTPASGPFQFPSTTDSISPSGSRTFRVTFSPSDTGMRAGSIIIASDAAGSPDTIPVNGRGIAPGFSSTRTNLQYGNTLIQSIKADSFIVMNTGNAMLHFSATLTPAVGPFQFSPATDSISPSGNRTFHVTFSPADTGMHTGNIIFTFDAAGSPDTLTVTGRGVAPGCLVTRTNITFGNVLAHGSRADSFSIANPGTAMLHIFASLVPTNAPFQLVSVNDSVSPGNSKNFRLTFSPSDTGSKVGMVIINHDAGGVPDTVLLNGRGVAPMFAASAMSIGFGNVLVHGSNADSFSVSNPGSAMLHFSVSLTPSAGSFQLASVIDSISPANSKEFHVSFSPADTGAKSGKIIFLHDATGSPDTVYVNGRGVAPSIRLSRTSVTFGNVLVHASKPDSISITNPGTAVLHFTASLTPAGGALQFTAVADSIPPQSAKLLRVSFAPGDTGINSGVIVFTHDAVGSPDTVPVYGRGVAPAFSVSKASLSFGSIPVNSSRTDSFAISNPGTAMLHFSMTLSPAVGSFHISTTGDSIPPLAGKNYYITFSPIDTGLKAGTARIIHDAIGSPDTVRLRGRGIMSPVFFAQSRGLSLGNVVLGTSEQDSIIVKNLGAIELNIDSVTSDNPEFGVFPFAGIISPATSRTFSLIFSPATTGTRTGNIVFYDNSDTSPDTVVVQGESIMQVGIDNGWNLVSVPLVVSDHRKNIVYPAAVSNAFAYQGGYIKEDALKNGVGYWLKFNAAQSASMSGVLLESDTISVSAGWNIIGSITRNLPVSAMKQLGTTIESMLYGYNRGYHFSDTLQAGKGYWIKVRTSGNLVLSTSLIVAKAENSYSVQEALHGFDSLVIEDAQGGSQGLFFGELSSVGLQSPDQLTYYDLPPAPPGGVLDVRFASGRMVEVADDCVPKESPILISGASYPLTVSWNVHNQSSVTDLQVGARQIRLWAKGRTAVQQPVSGMLLKFGGASGVPRQFLLEQNYPNPFNPTTTLRYQLPVDSKVTLQIYNILGQVIATLVDGLEEAGYKSVVWNPDNITSGVYIYRLEVAGNTNQKQKFVQARKMLLIR